MTCSHGLETIKLSGNDWLVKGFLGKTWEHEKAYIPEYALNDWYEATVPGGVYTDLLMNNVINNPYYELNSLLCEWVTARDWVYRKDFFIGPIKDEHEVYMVLKNVDYSCYCYLNGHYLGYNVGAYTPFKFNITQLIKVNKKNTLVVVVEHSPYEENMIGDTSKTRTHKGRMGYGWDFAARLIPIGIWGDVFIEITGKALIDDVCVRSTLNNSMDEANISIFIEIDSENETRCTIESQIMLKEKIVSTERTETVLISGSTNISQALVIKDPELWWPNGCGKQNVYKLQIILKHREPHREANNVIDKYSTNFGIRDVKFILNEGASKESRPYLAVINGRKVFMKGWNWVPPDQMWPSEKRYIRLLKLARDANVNLLRVWGGGCIENELFYDLCDEYGIMVWQEFVLCSAGGNNVPPLDKEYILSLKNEAYSIIKQKRNHPSLVIWCGGNELALKKDVPVDGSHKLIKMLKNVVKKLDPQRHFLPSSPSGPTFVIPENPWKNKGNLHDVHGLWKYGGPTKHYGLYNSSDHLLHSEFGADGACSVESLKSFISKENIWPPDETNKVWLHHGQWWINRHEVEGLFGPIDNINDYVLASQYIQAEAVRYCVEQNRRRMYKCSGSIPWQMNEPWPNTSCTSSIDWYTRPKMVYYFVKRAYKPVHVSLEYSSLTWKPESDFIGKIYISNSTFSRVNGNLTVEIYDLTGKNLYVKEMGVSIYSNCSQKIDTIKWPIPHDYTGLFIMRMSFRSKSGQCIDENEYLFSCDNNPVLSQMLRTKDINDVNNVNDVNRDGNISGQITEIKSEADGIKDIDVLITNKGVKAALAVNLQIEPGEIVHSYLSDNYLNMLPGESKVIKGKLEGFPLEVQAQQRKISIRGMNFGEVLIHIDS